MDHLGVKKAHIVGYSLGGMIAVKLLADHPDRTLSGTVGGMGWFRDGSALQKFWGLTPPRRRAQTPPALFHSVGKLAVTEKELKNIKVPVEILVGDRDPCLRLYVTPLRHVRGDWPVVEIKDAGHIVCIAKKQFRDEVANWIGKQAKP
jgi:pimeloyl-ACP methyl ester carboxylesterase